MPRTSRAAIMMTAAAATALLAGCAGQTAGAATPSVGTRADVSATTSANTEPTPSTDTGGAGEPATQPGPAQPPGPTRPTETTDQVVDGIRSLTISDDSGNVTVTATSGSGVHIVKKIFANPTRPKEQTAHVGSDLRITAPYCATPDWQRPCRIDYEVQAPPEVAVTLVTASGNLTLTGLTGVQSAVAASGSVHVTAAGGPVNAQSTSGNVDVTTTRVAQALTATSVSGNASVLVPAGHYRVETTTSTGDSAVTLANDPAGSALLRVASVTGNVKLGTTR